MSEEYLQLRAQPLPLVTCPLCQAPFSPFLRGQVQNAFLRLFHLRYCAVICAACKQVVGHERPFRSWQRHQGAPMITRDDLSSFRAEMVLHCQLCLDEVPPDVDPREWARLTFGAYQKPEETGVYLQLWCERHQCNVTTIHIENNQWSHDDTVPLRVQGWDALAN